MSRARKLNRMPRDTQRKMEIIGNGALEIYRRWKKEEEARKEVEAKEKQPARMNKRADKAVKQITTKLGIATITVLVKKNPHREGTQAYAQVELLRKCTTVGEALQQGKASGLTGLTKWKLEWFEKQKIIKIG